MSDAIVITGCAKRIGLGILDFYLKNTDYKLFGVVRRVSNDLAELGQQYPNRLKIVLKDLDKESFDIDFFKSIHVESNCIKGFVHCASKLLVDDIVNFNVENLDSQEKIHYGVFDDAVRGYVDFCKSHNVKDVCSFINFGDYKVSNGQTMGVSYTRSKLIAMKNIKNQAIHGLGYARVNMVSPGYTLKTEGVDEDFQKIIDAFPFKYTSTVDDICDAVNFLIHQKSVTGQHIVVDAGAGLANL